MGLSETIILLISERRLCGWSSENDSNNKIEEIQGIKSWNALNKSPHLSFFNIWEDDYWTVR